MFVGVSGSQDEIKAPTAFFLTKAGTTGVSRHKYHQYRCERAYGNACPLSRTID